MWTVVIVLLVLWALGFGFAGLGPIIHLLLVVAVIVAIVNLIRGRSVV